jgi:cobalt/nickel transport system permease protein
VSGSHGGAHALYVKGEGPIYRVRPECKLLAQILFVFAVVATPREAFWAFGLYALILIGLAGAAGLSFGFVARRMVIETPFLVFALLMPFFGHGEQVTVLGIPMYVSGLWAAWNILIKGTLGVFATIVVSATTPMADLLRGLERLHLPKTFTSIMGFMIRYLDVIAGEAQRMKVARESRGYDPRWIWQARAFAASAGALFIRSYERGERVHLAMLSRGYTGALPTFEEGAASRPMWAAALAFPAVATVIAIAAWVVTP